VTDRNFQMSKGPAPPVLFNYFRLWRLAFKRLRYLCFDIFLRRFLTSDPIQKPHIKGEKTALMVASFGN
jgi:hypothetical protein